MALSERECIELISHFFQRARDVDPSLHDRFEMHFEPEGDPQDNLERCLLAMMQTVLSESQEGYRKMLGQVGGYIQSSDGDEIDGVEIRLTPLEQRMYDAETLQLSELPDMGECFHQFMMAFEGIRKQ